MLGIPGFQASTALHVAVANGSAETAKVLINAACFPDVPGFQVRFQPQPRADEDRKKPEARNSGRSPFSIGLWAMFMYVFLMFHGMLPWEGGIEPERCVYACVSVCVRVCKDRGPASEQEAETEPPVKQSRSQ